MKKDITKAIGLLDNELMKAKSRQKSDTNKPSGCMRGLQIAIDILKEMEHK